MSCNNMVIVVLSDLGNQVTNMTAEIEEQKSEKYQDSVNASLLLDDIDRCSVLTIATMLFASVGQVLFLRRLFNKPPPRC